MIQSVAYTDPKVAWVGFTKDAGYAQGIKVRKGLFPWTASGRAIANRNAKTIHPHPTPGESIGMAAEIAHGSCTDVPPAKK